MGNNLAILSSLLYSFNGLMLTEEALQCRASKLPPVLDLGSMTKKFVHS